MRGRWRVSDARCTPPGLAQPARLIEHLLRPRGPTKGVQPCRTTRIRLRRGSLIRREGLPHASPAIATCGVASVRQPPTGADLWARDAAERAGQFGRLVWAVDSPRGTAACVPGHRHLRGCERAPTPNSPGCRPLGTGCCRKSRPIRPASVGGHRRKAKPGCAATHPPTRPHKAFSSQQTLRYPPAHTRASPALRKPPTHSAPPS